MNSFELEDLEVQGHSEPSKGAQVGGGAFSKIKTALLREGRLFDDPDFPASTAAISRPGGQLNVKNVVWKRPKDIVKNPVFIEQGASRFDLYQGQHLQDCWVIAAAASLAATKPELLQKCVPPDQSFDENYAGIFRFNFWHYDEIKEVVIDDKLPTVNDKLCFASNKSQPNEFWVPLLEKAYAKLYGCYENLQFGHMNNALVDFTGGISEMVNIKKVREKAVSCHNELFETIHDGMKKSVMLGCHIESTNGTMTLLPNGLYTGHAYSITSITKLKDKDQNVKVRFLRIRNPWGKNEWRGAWSDTSKEWDTISDKTKESLGMVVKEDGEFWMAFEDWLYNFDVLTLCHQKPDTVTCTDDVCKINKDGWKEQKHHSEWIKGFTAGGCGNTPYEEYFWRNPQFGLTVKPGPGGDKKCIVISLMQKSKDLRSMHHISVFLYQATKGLQLLKEGDIKTNCVAAKTVPKFKNAREVTVRYDLPPGDYIIIPCTFKPEQAGHFLLRIYTEASIKSSLMDDETRVPPAIQPRKDLLSVFTSFTKGEDKMDAEELNNALNSLLVADDGFTPFGIEMSRCLLSMMDKDKSGMFSAEEFRQLIRLLRKWKDAFDRVDKDRSGKVDTYQVVQIFEALGFRVSRQVQQSIIRHYGGKSNILQLNDVLHCMCKLVSLNDQYDQYSNGGSDAVKLTREAFLSSTLFF